MKGEINTEAELRRVKEYVAEYRTRLMSVSWYMKKSSGMIFHVSPEGVSLMDETHKAINEYVARMANEEDKCTGIAL